MKKLRILIVDDMGEVHEKLKSLEERYNIERATSEEEALNMIKENNYHGVLTDYHLGDKSPKGGLNVIRAAKEKGICSILMSSENHKEEAIEAGARGFVFKKRLFNKYSEKK